MSARLVIPEAQLAAALETLARAGIPVDIGTEEIPSKPPPAPAPAGTWTRTLPAGIPGEVAQSAGQVGAGYTVWLTAAAGDSIAWSLTAECEPVLLERGACPARLLAALGADELARVVRVATESVEEGG